MNFDIKEQVTYTVELTENEAILIGFALDHLASSTAFKNEQETIEVVEFSCEWDEMTGMEDGYDHLYERLKG